MLIEATDDDFDLLLARTAPAGLRLPGDGVEAEPVLTMLKALASDVRQNLSPAAWMIVEDGEVVGLCSITKAFRQPRLVEIGYGIAASRRRLGFASKAIGEVLSLMRTDGRVGLVSAETSTQNPQSQRVLEKNGFQRIGERIDAEDGPLICWQIRLD